MRFDTRSATPDERLMAARRAVDDTEPLEPTLLLALSWRATPGGEGTGGELLAALFGRDLGGELY